MTVNFLRNLTRSGGIAGVWVPAAVLLAALLVAVAIQVSRAESAPKRDPHEARSRDSEGPGPKVEVVRTNPAPIKDVQASGDKAVHLN